MVTTSNPETIALHTGYRADETTGAQHRPACRCTPVGVAFSRRRRGGSEIV